MASLVVLVVVAVTAVLVLDRDPAVDRVAADGDEVASTVASGGETTTTEATTTTSRPPVVASTTVLRETQRITGDISPKSVVASPSGLVIAQNMMYTHTVTAYRPDGALAATIDDGVDLAAFGVTGHPGITQGAPVEAAFTSDGRHAYVSNYSMYGAGFGPEGHDSCSPQSGYDDSYTYRIDTETFAIDQAIKVGAVPKYVAVTPDDTKVLVTNWCTYDLSVIDVASAREIAPHPDRAPIPGASSCHPTAARPTWR